MVQIIELCVHIQCCVHLRYMMPLSYVMPPSYIIPLSYVMPLASLSHGVVESWLESQVFSSSFLEPELAGSNKMRSC